jgi:DNA-binding XRE family transcriptional regulator
MKRPDLNLRRDRTSPQRWWTLREIREHCGVSQADLGHIVGLTQPAILKTENAVDPRLSTVRRYIQGLARAEGSGFDLYLVATIGQDEYRIRLDDLDGGMESPRSDLPEEPTGNAAPTPPNTATTRPGTTWRLRAWDDPDLEALWHNSGVITMSDDELGDLTHWPTDDELAFRLAAALPDRPQQAIGMFVTYWRYFRIEMSPGDLVLVPQSRKRVGIARITGDYRYVDDEPNSKLRHQRPVEWLRTIPRSELDEDIRKVVNAPGTICQVRAPGAAARLA